MCICEFGCNKEATYQFKSSGKWCCSSNVNACEGKKKKDSELKKGKRPNWVTFPNGHPRGMRGKIPSNKGKTYDEFFGKEKADTIRQKMSASMLGSTGWSKIDEETLKRIKSEASERAYRRHAEGWQGAIGRCKKIKYSSPTAGDMIVDGGWELSVAKYLDSLNIKWTRNKRRFKYWNSIKNCESTYCPDFYVEDWNKYIEVKGYKTDLDEIKWKQFTEELEIWDKNKLKELGIKAKWL